MKSVGLFTHGPFRIENKLIPKLRVRLKGTAAQDQEGKRQGGKRW